MKRIACLMLLLLGCSVLPLPAEMISRIAAVVNEDIITTHQLDQALQSQLASMDRRPSPAQLGTMRQQLLSRLIEETLLEQQTRTLNLTVTEDEVETAIQDVQSQNQLTREDLKAAVEAQGLSFESYRENLRKQILRYKLISTEVRSKIDVSEKEVLEYYRAHIEDYRRPPKLTLSALSFPFTKEADAYQKEAVSLAAGEAYQKLQQGRDLDAVAEEFRSEYGAEATRLGTFAHGEIAPEFLAATKGLDAGQYSAPVTKTEGIFVLRVDGRDAGGLRKFDEVKPQIYQLIMEQKTDARLQQWTQGLRTKAFIDIRL